MSRLVSVLLLATLVGCGRGLPAAGNPSAVASVRSEVKVPTLLYITTGSNIYVVRYPDGKLVETLGVPGYDLCAGPKGEVFIPHPYGIDEYVHGSYKPYQTFDEKYAPIGCAIDPASGDLAVTNATSGSGSIAIFRHAEGIARYYRDPELTDYGQCGYDDRGNLFVDGTGNGDVLAELPKGSKTFVNYSLGKKFDVFGGVEWDGKFMTLTSPTKRVIYRLKFTKSSVAIAGTTHVAAWVNVYTNHWPFIQTWMQGQTFLAQTTPLAEVGLWAYPKGGSPSRVISGFQLGPATVYGVAISSAK